MTDDDRLIDFLRERDIPCPQCEYNLRGLTSARCPECGQAVRLSVTLVEPYLKAWITLLTFACLGAGLGLFFVLIIAKEGWPVGQGAVINIAISILILMIPIVPIVILSRRRIQRRSHFVQWLLAGTCATVVLLAMLYFFASIR